MDALVSIIIPVYNVEKDIVECLNSIIHQTYTNLEILLIDDGSTDNSGEICKKYAIEDRRIKVIHKKNGGVSSARNTGLSLAQGEYISFVDSDDFVDKEYISTMYQNIIKTNSDLTFCKYSKYINKKTIAVKEDLPESINVDIQDKSFCNYVYRFFDLKQNIFGSSWRILFKKKLAYDIYFNKNINISEDVVFLMNIMLKAKLVTSVDQCLYFYRQASGSASHSYKKNYLKNQLNLYEELKRFFDLFENKNSKKIFDTYICLLCYYVLSNELKFKQQTRRINIKDVRESTIYKYFTLKNGLRIYGIKAKLKFLITWLLAKTRVV